MKRSPEILGAIARGYCSKKNSSKVLDPDLCNAMCDEVEKEIRKGVAVKDVTKMKECKDMLRALNSLYIVVDSCIAEDIGNKFTKFISKIQA